ncbi:MAG: inositol monophosphatase family protein [Rickettsiales bacterium]|nr:inositol monophosphatase family protein [Rickettsiales bacterium]
MSDFFNQNQIEKIISCAFAAGEIADKFFRLRNFEVITKSDNTKVTSADIAISKFIDEKLTKEFPQIPIICEEGKLRQVDDIFWLIDPIDGTTSFIEGNVEFAISIALIKNNRAIFGLIYAPLFENGKMIFSNHKNQIIAQDKSGKNAVIEFSKSSSDLLRIVTSPRTKDVDIKNYLKKFYPDIDKNFVVTRVSSAIKFLHILENKADLYLHFRQSMEWDTAAGQALIEMMNGQVKTMVFNQDQILLTKNLSYKKPNFLNQSFVAFIN